jgi:homoserine O-acetyltransferase
VQGTKFIQRFDPVTYVKLTEQMDTHDVGRGREGGVEGALSRITSEVLVMGIDSDILYPLAEQEQLAAHLPNCQFRVIHSPAGHDGFLLEQDQVSRHIVDLLTSSTLHATTTTTTKEET